MEFTELELSQKEYEKAEKKRNELNESGKLFLPVCSYEGYDRYVRLYFLTGLKAMIVCFVVSPGAFWRWLKRYLNEKRQGFKRQ